MPHRGGGIRDGRSAAARLDSQKEFWLSTDKLLLAIRIRGQAFEFIGHGGSRQGSFPSLITTMYNHACELANLPNDYRDKEGLRRELVKIGNQVINYAASRDATMLRGDIEEATIAAPFFCQDHQSGRQLTNFQEELKEAQAKVRRRDMTHVLHKDVNDDDFDAGRTKTRNDRKRAADEQWWSEQTGWSTSLSKQQRTRETKARESGDMLEKWSETSRPCLTYYFISYFTTRVRRVASTRNSNSVNAHLAYLRSVISYRAPPCQHTSRQFAAPCLRTLCRLWSTRQTEYRVQGAGCADHAADVGASAATAYALQCAPM